MASKQEDRAVLDNLCNACFISFPRGEQPRVVLRKSGQIWPTSKAGWLVRNPSCTRSGGLPILESVLWALGQLVGRGKGGRRYLSKILIERCNPMGKRVNLRGSVRTPKTSRRDDRTPSVDVEPQHG